MHRLRCPATADFSNTQQRTRSCLGDCPSHTSSISCAFCSKPFFLVFVSETVLDSNALQETKWTPHSRQRHSPTRFRFDLGMVSPVPCSQRSHTFRINLCSTWSHMFATPTPPSSSRCNDVTANVSLLERQRSQI